MWLLYFREKEKEEKPGTLLLRSTVTELMCTGFDLQPSPLSSYLAQEIENKINWNTPSLITLKTVAYNHWTDVWFFEMFVIIWLWDFHWLLNPNPCNLQLSGKWVLLRINYNIHIKVYCHWTVVWFLNYCVLIGLQKEENRQNWHKSENKL